MVKPLDRLLCVRHPPGPERAQNCPVRHRYRGPASGRPACPVRLFLIAALAEAKLRHVVQILSFHSATSCSNLASRTDHCLRSYFHFFLLCFSQLFRVTPLPVYVRRRVFFFLLISLLLGNYHAALGGVVIVKMTSRIRSASCNRCAEVPQLPKPGIQISKCPKMRHFCHCGSFSLLPSALSPCPRNRARASASAAGPGAG